MEEEEHEVYGGEIPDVGEMDGDMDMTGADDDAAKELDEMKRRLKEIEDEAAALREMQAKVEKDMGPQGDTRSLHRQGSPLAILNQDPDSRQAGNCSSSVYSRLKRRIWWATVAVYSWFMYSLAASGRLHLPLKIIKAELLIQKQLTRESAVLSPSLQSDFRRVLEFAPRLLEDLMKMAVIPHNEQGHGWLSPALGVIELSQCIVHAVPLSARKSTSEDTAPLIAGSCNV
ncbi:unnamed protein product [Brassica oleracea var. botrytis]